MSEDRMTAEESPTEWIAVPPEDDPFVDGGWAAPRRRSRLTIGLVAALLVAIGFLLGVTVEKVAASIPARVTTQQTGP